MTLQTTTTLRLLGISSETAAEIEVLALPVGRHHTLKPTGQTLVVMSGKAWVAYDGEDFILRPGDSLTLLPQPLNACLSAIDDRPVIMEIR